VLPGIATESWKNMQSSRPRSAVRAMSASSFIDRSVWQTASGWRQPVGWQPGTLKKAPKRNLRPVDFMTHHRKLRLGMQLVCQENRLATIPAAAMPSTAQDDLTVEAT